MASPLPGGPPTIPHDLQVEQKQGQATMIWTIGAFCILGWEWLICLPQEYERIWKRPFNPASFLYLANRYFGLIQFSFVISLVADVWSPALCTHVYLWVPVGALISTVLSQMILGSRVYAIYSQNKTIGFILGFTLIVEIVLGGISVSITSTPPVTGSPGMKPPCGAVMGPFGWLITFWTIPLLYEALAFLLTAWKAYDFRKKRLNTHLFQIIWRDGLFYFFAIFSMKLINIIIFVTVPKGLRSVNLSATLIFEVALSCRLLLNLRGAHAFSAAQPRWVLGLPKSSDNSKVSTNPSQSISNPGPGDIAGLRSTEFTMFDSSTVKLVPNQKNNQVSFDMKVSSGRNDV